MRNEDKAKLIKHSNDLFKNHGRSFGCLNPSCDNNDVIGSHSVSSKFLNKIKENGHVWRFALEETKNGISKKDNLIPLSKASKFKGFCKECDNKLFEPFETYEIELSAQHMSLLAFRSVAKEFHSKISALEFYENDIPEEIREHQVFLLERLRADRYSKAFKNAKKVLTEQKFDQFEHHIYLFDSPPFLLASSLSMSDILPSNRRLKIKMWEPFSINWIPVMNQCACVISIDREFSKKPKKIVSGFNKLNDEHVALALILMTIDNCENAFFKPSFIYCLNEREFKYLSELFYGFKDPYSVMQFPNFSKFRLFKHLPKLQNKLKI